MFTEPRGVIPCPRRQPGTLELIAAGRGSHPHSDFLQVKFASYVSSTSASGPERNRLSCGYVCTSQSFACNFMQTFLSQISSHNHKLCFYFLCQLKSSSALPFFFSFLGCIFVLQSDFIKVIAQVQTWTLNALHLCSKIFCFLC